nr:MAG TPA_asm: hypothetical protein [Caudoviricetes sp.]
MSAMIPILPFMMFHGIVGSGAVALDSTIIRNPRLLLPLAPSVQRLSRLALRNQCDGHGGDGCECRTQSGEELPDGLEQLRDLFHVHLLFLADISIVTQ